jgi:hypothetical protein
MVYKKATNSLADPEHSGANVREPEKNGYACVTDSVEVGV